MEVELSGPAGIESDGGGGGTSRPGVRLGGSRLCREQLREGSSADGQATFEVAYALAHPEGLEVADLEKVGVQRG